MWTELLSQVTEKPQIYIPIVILIILILGRIWGKDGLVIFIILAAIGIPIYYNLHPAVTFLSFAFGLIAGILYYTIQRPPVQPPLKRLFGALSKLRGPAAKRSSLRRS